MPKLRTLKLISTGITQLLDKVLMEHNLKDMTSQIYNSDKSGFVTDTKSGIVLARKGSERVNQSIGGSGRVRNSC